MTRKRTGRASRTLWAERAKKNDNSNLQQKIQLREWLLADAPRAVRVADLFAGHGTVWDTITAQNPDRQISLTRADASASEGGKKGMQIAAENLIDACADHDIIDCDDYGVPVNALHKIAATGARRIVVTCGVKPFSQHDRNAAFKVAEPESNLPTAADAKAFALCIPSDEWAEYIVRGIARMLKAKECRYFWRVKGAVVIYCAFRR